MNTVRSKRSIFHCVWNKNGVAPAESHAELQAAFRAADRLAQEHPGHKFLVFKAISKHWVPGPKQPLTPCRFCGQMKFEGDLVAIAADCRRFHHEGESNAHVV